MKIGMGAKRYKHGYLENLEKIGHMYGLDTKKLHINIISHRYKKSMWKMKNIIQYGTPIKEI